MDSNNEQASMSLHSKKNEGKKKIIKLPLSAELTITNLKN